MAKAIDGGTLRDNLTDIYGNGNRLVYLNDVLDLIDEQPTLTPPNEWVSVENAVPDPGERVLATDGTFVGEAYRTSANTWYRHTGFPWRDCLQSIVTLWMPLPTADKDNHVPAKAPNEPLTIEQMREMLERSEIIGAAVIVSDGDVLCCGVLDERADDGICASTGASGEWLKEKDYGDGWLAYAYPAARIDREKWEPCDACSNAKHIVGLALAIMDDGSDHRIDTKMNCEYSFCPNCGRPLTDEAWAELERRVCGEV